MLRKIEEPSTALVALYALVGTAVTIAILWLVFELLTWAS